MKQENAIRDSLFEKREKLEGAINALCEDFENETGLIIDEVQANHKDLGGQFLVYIKASLLR